MRLIDADAFKTRLEHEAWSRGHVELLRARDIADETPAVDAVPVRHGKWTRENNYGIWKCSECGCKVNRSNPLKGNIWNYYFCPNCGARMDEE